MPLWSLTLIEFKGVKLDAPYKWSSDLKSPWFGEDWEIEELK